MNTYENTIGMMHIRYAQFVINCDDGKVSCDSGSGTCPQCMSVIMIIINKLDENNNKEKISMLKLPTAGGFQIKSAEKKRKRKG